jgi:hypothetical protein
MVSIRPAIAFGLLGVAGLAGAAAVAQVGAGRRPAAKGGAQPTLGFAVTDLVSCFYDTVKPVKMAPQLSAEPDEIRDSVDAPTREKHADISSLSPRSPRSRTDNKA